MKNQIKKEQEVTYTDKTNSVLTNGETYKVSAVLDNGAIQVYIKTGFAGLTKNRYEIKG